MKKGFQIISVLTLLAIALWLILGDLQPVIQILTFVVLSLTAVVMERKVK